MNEVFEKYYSKIKKQAILKSALFAVAAAFIAVAVAGLIFWFVGFEQVWLLAVIAVAAFAAAMPALYFLLFRPTKRDAAKRMDSQLGLEERMLTMVELEYSNSPIAYLQKQDTVSALSTASTKAITFAVTAAIAITLPIAVAVGAAGVTVSALTANGIIPSGTSLIAFAEEQAKEEYIVTYLVDGGGEIIGEKIQAVVSGKDAKPVIASPDIGGEDGQWVFIGWSDGVNTPSRTDKKIEQNKTVTARFKKMNELPDIADEEIPSDDKQYIFDPNAERDPNKKPSNPSDSLPADPDDTEDGNGGSGAGDGAGGGGGGIDSDFNQVNDGNTYYGGSTFQDAYDQASDEMSNSGDIPDDVKDAIDDYFGTIKK